MAPGGGGKRKRAERTWSNEASLDAQRPSPHRPGNLNMAQSREQADTRSPRGNRNNRGRRGSGPRLPPAKTHESQAQSQPALSVQQDMEPESITTAPTPEPTQAIATPEIPQRGPTPPPAEFPDREIAPYAYEYMKTEIIAGWEEEGRSQIVKTGQDARSSGDVIALSIVFQEVFRSALDKRLGPEEAGHTIRDIIGSDSDMDAEAGPGMSTSEAGSLFLDTVSLITNLESYGPALKRVFFATEIPSDLMRRELDQPLLLGLGLVRGSFTKMGIRKTTNLIYRQSNYNLLREETEGYSKLLTELFTTSGNGPPTADLVKETFERVRAMIGAFDLDVGRALDVTLDVFAAVLVKHYRFFVKFLRVSSWWPHNTQQNGDVESISDYLGLPAWAKPESQGWTTSEEEKQVIAAQNESRDSRFWDLAREKGIQAFMELGRRVATEEDLKKLGLSEEELAADASEDSKWIKETKTFPPNGNRVAAQLLGFKLRFYSSSARNASDVLPDNLIYLAALLIKVGFISLRDLYPHLWPLDEDMAAVKEVKLKEKAERERAARPGAGAMNALMMAGALVDDTIPAPRLREAEKPAAATKDQPNGAQTDTKADDAGDLPEPADQKISLLKSLLAIGAIPEALFILGRFPWLMDVIPELTDHIHRILHHCLSKVWEPLRTLPNRDSLRQQKRTVDTDQSGMPKGNVRLTNGAHRKILRWALLDKSDNDDGTDYRFYWDDWSDNIPVCQNVDDVFALCNSFLNLSGVKIGQDPTLLTKLIRIGRNSLELDRSESNEKRWVELSKRLLVPALSLSSTNSGLAHEVFLLLNFFPQDVRFSIYAEWNSGAISRLPDVKSAFDQAKAETRDLLKRISKTNFKQMARPLAKISASNPGVVVITAIGQMESYENFIEVFVDCARYFTLLAYDVLTWAIIDALGRKGRSRVQEGGMLTSKWLGALSVFGGRTFKRYSLMDPTPILQYVAEQLRLNNSTDLVVLEQIVSSMAGIVTDTNFNDNQIQAMAGGQLLQSQTMLQLLDKRHESKVSSRRLLKSLLSSNLAGQLLIAISQERRTCIFKDDFDDADLKLLGNIFDEIHRILGQYLDLLRSSLTEKEFQESIPALPVLIGEFGIEPEIAFWISRPTLAYEMLEATKNSEEVSQPLTPIAKEVTDDIEMVDETGNEIKEEDEISEQTNVKDEMEVDKSSDAAVDTIPNDQQVKLAPEFPWNSVLRTLKDGLDDVMPSETWEIVGRPFYITFWQLSLYDIYIPQKAYEDEIDRQKKAIQRINNDRSDLSMAGVARKDAQKKKITELQDRLLAENKSHLKAYGQTRSRLQAEKDGWFVGMRGKYEALGIALLEQCILPRLRLSPVDAFFCFKVIKYLHSSGTPNFRTIALLDQLFRDGRVTALIFSSTSKEADYFGRFLNEILKDLNRWHTDKAVYEREAYGVKRDLPGFARTLDGDNKPTLFFDHEEFRSLLYKWHRILTNCLKTCLSGGEYMHIRNAISVLKAVVTNFPVVNWMGGNLRDAVTALKESGGREDVTVPAASLIGELNRREKKWIIPQAFHVVSATLIQTGVPELIEDRSQTLGKLRSLGRRNPT